MAEAIRKLPLEPHLVGADDQHVLRATLYAYLRARIPAMLGIRLDGLKKDCEPKEIGYHAVAVTGYSLGLPAPNPDPRTGMLLRAGRIDKLYTHDDQVGPFARMEFDATEERAFLTTSWGEQRQEFDKVNAAPNNVLFPLYHKIRIPFDVVHNMLVPFDRAIEMLRDADLLRFHERCEWDIHLTDNSDFKSAVFEGSVPLNGVARRTTLIQSMPRFLWRATCLNGGSPILDILFDATDIEQGSFVFAVYEFDEELSAVLRTVVPNLEPLFRQREAWRIFEHFTR